MFAIQIMLAVIVIILAFGHSAALNIFLAGGFVGLVAFWCLYAEKTDFGI